MGNHGAAGGISERRCSSCSSLLLHYMELFTISLYEIICVIWNYVLLQGMVLFILWISEKYCKCCQPGPFFDDDISDDEELLLEDGATDEALNPQFIDAAEPDRHPVSC